MRQAAATPRPALATRALDLIDRGVRAAVVITLALMVVVVSTQVLLRYGFNRSLDWGEDVARMLFVWTIFLAIPLGIRHGAHIGIELLVARLAPGLRRALVRFTGALATLLMAAVCWQAGRLTIDQWDENLPTLDISVGLFMVPVCLGAALSVLHMLPVLISGEAPRGSGSAE